MEELEFWPEYRRGPLWRQGISVDAATVQLPAELAQRMIAWNGRFSDAKLPLAGGGDREWIAEGRALVADLVVAFDGRVDLVVTEPWWEARPVAGR